MQPQDSLALTDNKLLLLISRAMLAPSIHCEDNTKAWSGDHCIDPRLVPGIFFSTQKINTSNPSIMDIAPTALTLFGLEIPPHMDGHSLVDTQDDYATQKKNIKEKKES